MAGVSRYGNKHVLPQNGRLASGKIIQPLTGNNMEVGIKNDWANGNWSTTLSVYRILKNNEQTASPNSTPNNPIYIELGQKRAQGIEFDLHGKIANGLNLIANYAYTDSRVTKVNKEGTSGIKVGDQVPGYAKQTANAWLTYKLQDGGLKGLGMSAGSSFVGGRETYWDVSPDPTQKLPDYIKFDGGLFWENAKLKVTANVFNIANKFTYSGSYYSWLNAYYWQADAPRNLRFSISYKF